MRRRDDGWHWTPPLCRHPLPPLLLMMMGFGVTSALNHHSQGLYIIQAYIAASESLY